MGIGREGRRWVRDRGRAGDGLGIGREGRGWVRDREGGQGMG